LKEERSLRVFEYRVLRRIIEPKRNEVTWDWRKLHNEELNDLYWSPNIVLAIKSSYMLWVGHVARVREGRGVYRVLVGNLRERGYLEESDLDGRVILDGCSRS